MSDSFDVLRPDDMDDTRALSAEEISEAKENSAYHKALEAGQKFPKPEGWKDEVKTLSHGNTRTTVFCSWYEGAFWLETSFSIIMAENVGGKKVEKEIEKAKKIISRDPEDAELAIEVFEVFLAHPISLQNTIDEVKKRRAEKSENRPDEAKNTTWTVRKLINKIFGW